MDYMSQLPIELLAHVISLSLDTLNPRDRLIRTERLRLVNKTWQAAIDSTPDFWACIPNEPYSLETTKRWIQKSGQVPLHIYHTRSGRPFEGYMQLVTPHIHRWRKVEIVHWGHDVWKYFSEPAPTLEELLISESNVSSDHIPFKGITPSLSSVELVRVTIPENISFLRNLKELRLQPRGYWSNEGCLLSKYCDILDACPDLEKLQLDAYAIRYPLDQRPVLLAKLSSFSIRGDLWKPDCLEAILDMITAPSLSNFYLPFNQNWVPPTMNILSPLSTDLLRNFTRYQLSVSHGQFHLSTDAVQDPGQAAPKVTFDLSFSAKSGAVALKLFQSFENAVPSSALVDVTFDQSPSTRTILNHLKSMLESVDGILRYPLPQLHSVQLNIKGKSRISFEDLLINLAQVRQDVSTIRVYDRRRPKKSGIRVSQWDPETSSFVLI